MRGLREKLNDARSKLLRRTSRESPTGSLSKQGRQSLSRDGSEAVGGSGGARASNSKLNNDTLSDLRNDTASDEDTNAPGCLAGLKRKQRQPRSEGGSSLVEVEVESDTDRDNPPSSSSLNLASVAVKSASTNTLPHGVTAASSASSSRSIGEGEVWNRSRGGASNSYNYQQYEAVVGEAQGGRAKAEETSNLPNNSNNNSESASNPHQHHTTQEQPHQHPQSPLTPSTPSPTSNPKSATISSDDPQQHQHQHQHQQHQQSDPTSNIIETENVASTTTTSSSQTVKDRSTRDQGSQKARGDDFALPIGSSPAESRSTLAPLITAASPSATTFAPTVPATKATTSATSTSSPFTDENWRLRVAPAAQSSLLAPSVPPTSSSSSSPSSAKPEVDIRNKLAGLLIPPESSKDITGVSSIQPSPASNEQPVKPEFPRISTGKEGPTNLGRKTSIKEQVLFLRRQSLLPHSDAGLIHSLLQADNSPTVIQNANTSLTLRIQTQPISPSSNTAAMSARKVWVKRPGGSPTQIVIVDDDLIDAVRDMCLKKYSNALGRQYDAPDLLIKILPPVKTGRSRHHSVSYGLPEKILGPEEVASKILDEYYPAGQAAEEALIVEIPPAPAPTRRTPRPSPGPGGHIHSLGYPQYAAPVPNVHELHIGDANDYFPPMSKLPGSSHSQTSAGGGITQIPNSMAIVASSPPVPGSPGRFAGHTGNLRPRRFPTQSPTAPPANVASAISNGSMGVMLMPRGGGSSRNGAVENSIATTPVARPPRSASPKHVEPLRKTDSPAPAAPPRVASPRPPKKTGKKEKAPSPSGLLDGAVPPINVLIVEDNIINLKLLEAFMKRLKVRWQTAMNGKEAVNKWRVGGFHLVLMDIQLPVMNGLEATKEIRRLERVNSIGSFSSSANAVQDAEPLTDEDKLPTDSLFKSPVIIVALTASSLQSDRHEALAAGCNDFLTKPVNFIFLERKVTEWGCMQALIDFDGWKSWVGVR